MIAKSAVQSHANLDRFLRAQARPPERERPLPQPVNEGSFPAEPNRKITPTTML